MANSVFELIQDTQLELSLNSSSKVTRGTISEITADSGTDSEILWRAYAAVQVAGYSFGAGLAGHPDLTLQRLVIKGFTNDGCNVWLYHETPNFGGSPVSAFIARHRAYMSSRQTNTIIDASGHRVPIKIKGFTTTGGDVLAPDYATINHLCPVRCVEYSGLTYGAPSNQGFSLVGYANLEPWSGGFGNALAKGFWLCSEFETDLSRYANYFTFRMSAITRCTIDWAEIVVLRNEKTGKFVDLPQSAQDDMATTQYQNDVAPTLPGVSKVGPFPLAPFGAIFGVI